jgi:uncharacterized damage-inducible protein DinB
MRTVTEATVTERLLDEFREETAITRRILERVPADKLGWKPHPRSMSLGQLAMHIAMVPGSLARLSQQNELDVAQENFEPPSPKSVQEILAVFEQNVIQAEKCLEGMTDEQAQGSWRLISKGEEVFRKPRISIMRTIGLSHWYHHRGQLSVYLRMVEVPVPVIYGRSADENPFA